MVWMGGCGLKQNLRGIPVVPGLLGFIIHMNHYLGWDWNYLVPRSRSPSPTWRVVFATLRNASAVGINGYTQDDAGLVSFRCAGPNITATVIGLAPFSPEPPLGLLEKLLIYGITCCLGILVQKIRLVASRPWHARITAFICIYNIVPITVSAGPHPRCPPDGAHSYEGGERVPAESALVRASFEANHRDLHRILR